MTTAAPGSSKTSLDDQIDEAERLILEGELGSAADLLEEARLEARSKKDVASLNRIAGIAGSARELRWRYRITFDTLKAVTEESIRIIEPKQRPSVAAEERKSARSMPREQGPSDAGALVAAAIAHLGVLVIVVVAIIFTLTFAGGSEDWPEDDVVILALFAWLGFVVLTWFAALGVAIWRWLRFRDPVEQLMVIAGVWGALAYVVPLIALIAVFAEIS